MLTRLINLITPRRCVMCGCRLAIGEDVVCTACNIELPRTGHPASPRDNELARLFWGRIPVERAAALFYYRAHSAPGDVIYSMKYRSHPETGELMGRMAAKEFAACGFFDGIDAIVPVPLAKKRQRERGYNQSLEIARGVSTVTRIPITSKALKRKSFEASQTGNAVKGKHILIIDDVVTTGATVISCTKELMKAGGTRFSVMSLGFTKG